MCAQRWRVVCKRSTASRGGSLLEEGELVLEPLLGELLGGRDREEL